MDVSICTKNLAVGYGKRRKRRIILSDINLLAHSGSLIALVGPNGKGKSTLLKTIAGFIPALEGEIYINNQSLANLSIADRARIISYVGTSHEISRRIRVRELIALGRYQYTNILGSLSDADYEIVHKAMLETKVLHLRDAQVGEISDGEFQRVMIARCLAQDTPIILLDEPTAFLDIANKFEMVEMMRRLVRQKNKTIIFSSHDLPTVIGNADLMWFIFNKTIIEAIPEELVMTGFMDSFFEHSNVMFDIVKNEFRIKQNPTRWVRIIGEPAMVSWTEKALLRYGIGNKGIVNDNSFVAEDLLEIKIKTVQNNLIWEIVDGNQNLNFDVLKDLLAYVNEKVVP